MEIIKNVLKNKNNPGIIRIDYDHVENQMYYQYRFKINKDTTIDFKYYADKNIISQIYLNGIEYLGFYKVDIIDEILKNIDKKINTKNFLII